MARREYAGGAIQTTITGAIDAVALSITLADASGWPTGASGNFSVVLDRGTSDEEKIECSLQTGAVVTIATRGFDSTIATAHSGGATAEVILSAVEMDEVNRHTFDVAQDDHTQYLNTTRHSSIAHDTGSIADGAITQPKLAKPAVGTPELIDDGVTAAKLGPGAVDETALGTDAVATIKIQDDAVTAAKLGPGAVDNTALGTDAVTSDKILDGEVSTTDLKALNVTQAKLEVSQQHHIATNFASLPAGQPQGVLGYTTDTDSLYGFDGSDWQFLARTPIRGKIERNTGIQKSTPFSFVSMNDEIYLEGGMLKASNNEGFTIPTGAGGLYTVGIRVTWDASASGNRGLRFDINSSAASYPVTAPASVAGSGWRGNATEEFELADGDNIRLEAYQSAGTLGLVDSGMWIRRIGD